VRKIKSEDFEWTKDSLHYLIFVVPICVIISFFTNVPSIALAWIPVLIFDFVVDLFIFNKKDKRKNMLMKKTSGYIISEKKECRKKKKKKKEDKNIFCY
jgi:membrane protein insertase Oxa1/YidC/SpoIIIJ